MLRRLTRLNATFAAALLAVASCGGETTLTTENADSGGVRVRSSNNASDLRLAIANGDIEEVKRLVSAGVDVNVKGEDGTTPLHWAAWAGQMMKLRQSDLAPQGGVGSSGEEAGIQGAIAEFLVGKGADANTKDMFNSTPLHAAAFHGNVAVAKVLLANGAEISATRDDGATPLSLAVTSGHSDMVELLKASGVQTPASPQSVREDMQACERGYDPDPCRKAIAHMDMVIEARGSASNRQRASAHAAKARILSNSFDQHREAIAEYEQALALNPTNAEFLYNRGNAHLRLNEHDHAIDYYTKAIEADSAYLAAYGSRGWAYHLIGRNEVALGDYEHLLRVRPDDLRGLLNRSVIYTDLGRKSEAVADLKRAYSIQPDNPYVQSKLTELGEELWLKRQ